MNIFDVMAELMDSKAVGKTAKVMGGLLLLILVSALLAAIIL